MLNTDKTMQRFQHAEIQGSMGLHEMLTITKVYQQDLSIIRRTNEFAIGFTLQLDVCRLNRNITIVFSIGFGTWNAEQSSQPPIIQSLFPNKPLKSWIKARQRSNPADESVAYPIDFDGRFGNQSSVLYSMGIGTTKATWVLKPEHASQGFSLIMTIEVIAVSPGLLPFLKRSNGRGHTLRVDIHTKIGHTVFEH
ncbi:hypothetical protein BT69DRAFT_1382983 [Atractiella rhizophila]|nr:hypothetical protein BT69DRAFT_1382983 [Atractiella rhizophila]